jgi:hypothetical protein
MIEVKEPPPKPTVDAPPAGSAPPSKKGTPALGPSRKGVKDQIIERYEKKYLIHARLMPQIRKWMEPFVIPDPNAKGAVPEYTTTTMQLDTPYMHLAIAGERYMSSRFKMRVRTYGYDANPKNAVFIELKRRVQNGMVVKSRSMMTRAMWHPRCITHPDTAPMLKSAKDNSNFMDFCRLARELGARPKMLIRYIRESYFSANDDYARITFDRRVSYRTHHSWNLVGPEVSDWKCWRPIDTSFGMGQEFSPYILELKSMADSPTWMLEMAERFNLAPVGFCKYATALRLENNTINGISYDNENHNLVPYQQVFC